MAKGHACQNMDKENHGHRWGKAYRCWQLVLPLLLFAVTTRHLAAQPFPRLTQLYKVQQSQADFVFVIDTSLSMQPFFGRVRSACVEFLKSLPSDDRVFLIQFARTARLLTPEGVAARENAHIETVLPQSPSLSPEGDWTDIGRAFEEVVSLLASQASRPIACLVFLTDGEHNPPPNSIFSSDADAGAWMDLREKAREAVRSKRFFRAYGIGLRKHTDIALLSKVFGSQYCAVLPSTPQQLRATLDAIKQELLRDRLRQLVQEELKRDTVRWSQEQFGQVRTVRHGEYLQLSYRLDSGLTVLPVRWQLSGGYKVECSPPIEGIEPSALPTFVQVTPSEGTLVPKQTIKVQVRLALPPLERRRLKLASRTIHTLRVTVPYTIYAEPKEEIEQLQLSPAVEVVSEQGEAIPLALQDTVQVAIEEGEPMLNLIKRWLSISLLFIAIAATVWYFAPTPFGYLAVQPRRTYPLKGQVKAKSRWMVQLLFICASVLGSSAAGAVVGLLGGSWLTFYVGTAAGPVAGLAIGWQRWGRKEVSAGGSPTCDIYLKEATNTVRFFVRQGQMYYYTADPRETKPLSDGSEVMIAGIQATWRERYL